MTGNGSSTTKPVGIAQGFFESHSIALNTFSSDTQPAIPKDEPPISSINSATADDILHSFDESMKGFYHDAHVFTDVSEFYNHTAYLFVRLSTPQLTKIKMCQLQVALYNKGIYTALQEAGLLQYRDPYQSQEYFPTLTWIPFTFSPSSINMNDPNGWRYGPIDNNLILLSSHLTDDMIHAFANQQDYGPRHANITPLIDFSINYKDAGIHLDDLWDWEWTINYVNNMINTYENTVCNGNEKFNTTMLRAFPINQTSTLLILLDNLFPGAFNDPPFQMLISGIVDQEEVTVNQFGSITIGSNTYDTLSITRSTTNPIEFTSWPTTKNFSCTDNDFPSEPPSQWECSASHYWKGDGCHCDCGFYDPDCCQQINATIYNCRNNEQCSPAGNCVTTAVFEPNYLWLSEDCLSINYAGDKSIVGFLGSTEEFNNISQGICQACPLDPYYSGSAMLNEFSQFVCNYIPFATINGDVNKDSKPGEYQVFLNASPFPEEGYPYPIIVSSGEGPEESLLVYNSTVLSRREQILQVRTDTGALPKRQHTSYGKLWSACDTDTKSIIVIANPIDSNSVAHYYANDGPYSISAAKQPLIVTAATEYGSGRIFQILSLGVVPSQDVGFRTVLSQPAMRGDTSIIVEPFRFWYDVQLGLGSFPNSFPITLRGDPFSTEGVEIAWVTSYSQPNWTCDPIWYARFDGCDCNCGIIDPDCTYPSPAGYNDVEPTDSSASCVISNNCSCTYCSYPEGKCTNIKPNGTSLISPLRSEFAMQLFLQDPIKINHQAGYIVDTPISVEPHGSNEFDWNGSFYDVFTNPVIQFDSGGALEFPPSDRYTWQPPETTFSPDSIDIDIGMFTVPDTATFENAPLCPSLHVVPNPIPPIFTSNDWNLWNVDPARQLNVSGCNLKKLDDNCVDVFSVPKDQYNVECIVQMPPTYEFDFIETIPVNNKWHWNPKTGEDVSQNPPEYLIDVDTIYYFTYDKGVERVEDGFAGPARTGGDLDQNNIKRVFFGEIFYHGLGQNSTSVPANIPYLFADVKLNLSPWAKQDASKYGSSIWPTGGDLSNLLSKFPSINITWNLDTVGGSTQDQSITLLPGTNLFLGAEIEIQPILSSDFLEVQHLIGWNTRVVSTSASAQDLDWFNRQESHVRYTITITPTTKQVIRSYTYDIKAFFDSIGSAFGILGIGIVILTFWHKLTRTAKKLKKEKEILDEQEFEVNVSEVVKKKIALPQRSASKSGNIKSSASISNDSLPSEIEETR